LPKFDPLEAFDAWELEEKLAHVRRILGRTAAEQTADSEPLLLRVDGPSAFEIGAPYTLPAIWALTKLAVSAITCGAILAAWWWMAGRQDLIKPALVSLAVGHLAWLGKWCCEGYSATTCSGN
jgi:hypothetical protein